MEIAIDNLEAAHELKRRGRFRSAVSRAYYAAYAAGHAIGLRAGQQPRAEFNTWAHATLPEVLHTAFRRISARRGDASAVMSSIVKCRALRDSADYNAAIAIGRQDADEATRLAGPIVRAAEGIVHG